MCLFKGYGLEVMGRGGVNGGGLALRGATGLTLCKDGSASIPQ